jgi:hypothetical protein
MHRKNFGGRSGVIVDVCGAHGIWFDLEELPRVLAFVEAGGLERAQAERAQAERAASERRLSASSVPGGSWSSSTSDWADLSLGITDLAAYVLRRILEPRGG